MTDSWNLFSEPLLKTKIFVPVNRKAFVDRPRLINILNAGMEGKLTLLSAPPGFGKTSLLSEWAARSQVRVGWFSLDENDNDLLRFYSYLLTALEQVSGEKLAQTVSLLQSPQSFQLPMLVRSLISELEFIPHPFVLVLDDYHTINNSALHEAMVQMIEHLPQQMHLVIATRADPPMPLALMRARRELTELRAEDLRFNLEECADFLNSVAGLRLDPKDITALEERTEGWIAGLQMAALSMHGRQDIPAFIRAFSGSHRFILDYLLDEVLARQPKFLREFLMRTSILKNLNSSLCDAVLGESWLSSNEGGQPASSRSNTRKSQAVLEQLEQANLFITPLDDDRRWYRYHHLFAELLKAQLEENEGELISVLHTRAARWYSENGQPTESVQHAFSAGDFELAAEILERYGLERWSFSDVSFMMLIQRLPEEMRFTRPQLGVYYAWTMIISGKPAEAEVILKNIMKYIPEDDSSSTMRSLQNFVSLLLAYLPLVLGRQTEFTLPDRQVLEYVPIRFLAMRNSADVVYAYMLTMRGEFDEAAEILMNAVRRDNAAGGTTAIPIAISRLARMRIEEGRLLEAAQLCREYLITVQERGAWQYFIPGNLDIVLGSILLEWSEWDQAEYHIKAGMEANTPWSSPQAQVLGQISLARLEWARGSAEAGMSILENLEQAIIGRNAPPDLSNEIQSLKVKLWLAQGKITDALSWLEKYGSEIEIDYWHELENISRARVLLALGKEQEALTCLDRLSSLAQAGKRFGRLLEIQLLQALVFNSLHRPDEAFASLKECLNIAEPQGYQMIFIEAGEPLRELMLAYSDTPGHTHAEYASQLIEIILPRPGKLHSPPSQAGLVETLTMRELQVLEMVCAGYSNQVIAEKLVITLSAVKKHTGNIYGKLGVTSRTQAIALAHQLGLINLSD